MIGDTVFLQTGDGVSASPGTTELVWGMLAVFGLVMVYLAYRGYQISQAEDDMEGFTLAKGYLGPVSLGVAFAATSVLHKAG